MRLKWWKKKPKKQPEWTGDVWINFCGGKMTPYYTKEGAKRNACEYCVTKEYQEVGELTTTEEFRRLKMNI